MRNHLNRFKQTLAGAFIAVVLAGVALPVFAVAAGSTGSTSGMALASRMSLPVVQIAVEGASALFGAVGAYFLSKNK